MPTPVEKGLEFEESVVKVLNHFGLNAFRTNKANSADPEQYKAGFDGGVDIIATFRSSEGSIYKEFVFYIQCKCQRADLTKQAISEVYAGMHARNAKNKLCIPVVFCNCNATKETRQFAMDLGVELYLKENHAIITKAEHGEEIPYSNYGILMKVLLFQITKNKCWLDSLPDYQSNIFDLPQLEKQLLISEMDFNEAQSYLDEASQYERKAQEKRQLALDVQRNAVMRTLKVSGTIKNRKEKKDKKDKDLESG